MIRCRFIQTIYNQGASLETCRRYASWTQNQTGQRGNQARAYTIVWPPRVPRVGDRVILYNPTLPATYN